MLLCWSRRCCQRDSGQGFFGRWCCQVWCRGSCGCSLLRWYRLGAEACRKERRARFVVVLCVRMFEPSFRAPCAQCGSLIPVVPFIISSHVVNVNLIGSFNVARLVAAQMVKGTKPSEENERGCIIFVASIAAFEGQAGQAAYAAAKSGLVGMALPLARDMSSQGVRIMTIAPGLFETPLMAGASDKVKENLIRTTEFPRRLGRAPEFASMAVQCLENPMMNGSTVRV